ncbi:MAG: hypothetical protein AAFY33_06065 [Cyanobacteria bacterium J06643_4]
MTENDIHKPEDFFMPRSKYRGKFTPQNLIFDSNLQEFAQQVVLLCGLETSGKVSNTEAYNSIKQLWKDLKNSKENLLVEEEDLTQNEE